MQNFCRLLELGGSELGKVDKMHTRGKFFFKTGFDKNFGILPSLGASPPPGHPLAMGLVMSPGSK